MLENAAHALRRLGGYFGATRRPKMLFGGTPEASTGWSLAGRMYLNLLLNLLRSGKLTDVVKKQHAVSEPFQYLCNAWVSQSRSVV